MRIAAFGAGLMITAVAIAATMPSPMGLVTGLAVLVVAGILLRKYVGRD